MSIPQFEQHPRPLRLWPGVVAAVLIVLFKFAAPLVMPDASGIGVIAGLAGGVMVILWWLSFSRAPWSERLLALGSIVAAVLATRPFLHESIAGGLMKRMFLIYAVPPVLGVSFVAWAAISRRLSNPARIVSMVATIFLSCAVWTLARTDGIQGTGGAQLTWRWTSTAEERLLAHGEDEPKPLPPVPAAPEAAKPAVASGAAGARVADAPAPATGKAVEVTAVRTPATVVTAADPTRLADWPGFRGPRRDGVIRGLRIVTDWTSAAPVKMWERPIGPGWSSFAVDGDLLYTQEQRGEEEIVAAYRVSTGEPVWRHRDPARFWESNGGAGPRATPTLSHGRVYTFGATGILNALDARSGGRLWSRNIASDLNRKVPDWGFASSPLVVDDLVIVAASGSLTAYDLATGTPRWVGPRQLGSYSSPHRATIDGVTQVLLLSGSGAESVAPATGTLLWNHAWQTGATTIVQPAMTEDGDVLISAAAMTGGVGVRRLAVGHTGGGGWKVEERWTSSGLKPYFNDLVVHQQYAYGFDGSILSCIDLADGARKWKGGRYGNGQLVLLADQDVLLVVSEEGELALVAATPDGFKELGRVPGIEGKTWNHPAIVGNVLLVRNGEQMAAFRLGVEGR